VNVGRRCDLACHHCHVEAGPKRTESLDARTAARVLEILAANPGVALLDLTGGAPELNPSFRDLVTGARSLGRRVIDRCNLTVLFQPGQEDTAEFLAEHEVEVVASLPCYELVNVDAQRGHGTYARSIEALRRLNGLGYGHPGSPRVLDLVYNPLGASLPPAQSSLGDRYRAELRARFGIEFHHLLTITNVPVGRFAHALARDGQLDAYLALLVNHFNAATLPGLMCRSLVSVAWDGSLHDCDFHQMAGIPIPGPERTLWDVLDLSGLEDRSIATASHCFACTAGAGSSCGGALA
jgi:radical SAM/Cys-rich protein